LLTRTTRDWVAKKASKDEHPDVEEYGMDRSRSLLADDVGDRSNDGRWGAKLSMIVGSSWDSFRHSGHEYTNGDSREFIEG